MFGNIKEQLKSAQSEMKEKLAETQVSGKAGEGKVEVVVNGNRKMISLDIAPELFEAKNQEEIQQLIIEASNDALTQAENIAEDEMMNSAKNMLPGIF
ncbi:MAG: YbaB/EbfC family nucleoid-associated protein [Bacteroidales bacterium]|nr:YbaB/EbfC family nucleoid-associated protein [Bacteroidales bacterium]MCF8327692.1 YbaB/EbfC family nucleoid-associated protein [Bacteroidales bacterium]